MKKLQLGKYTQIMGILNVTPDSFSDSGEYFRLDKSLSRAEEMIADGADIIDIGGESTRPASENISEEEEIKRVIPVIQKIRDSLGEEVFLSIDTYKAEVAEAALAAGADMVNSLGGFLFDKNLVKIVAKTHCPFLFYHIKGNPKTMQQGEIVYKDVIDEIKKFFEEQIKFGLKNGIMRKQFILDPGIGFGKTTEQNLEILKRLDEFASLNLPIAIGVSRKSHIGKLLQDTFGLKEPVPPKYRLEGSLAETAIAVLQGAKIVRTHDVMETKKFLTVLEKLL